MRTEWRFTCPAGCCDQPVPFRPDHRCGIQEGGPVRIRAKSWGGPRRAAEGEGEGGADAGSLAEIVRRLLAELDAERDGEHEDDHA